MSVSTDALLEERGKTHGDYADHAQITQALKRVMQGSKNWELLSDMQKESLEMQVHKIGRILSGNPDYIDSWRDIEGYVRLVVRYLESTDGSSDCAVQKRVRINGEWRDERSS